MPDPKTTYRGKNNGASMNPYDRPFKCPLYSPSISNSGRADSFGFGDNPFPIGYVGRYNHIRGRE
jgi:hypothetical protein